MTHPMPEAEHLGRAVKWISEGLQEQSEKKLPQLVDQAIFRFDLSPKDAEYLINFFRSAGSSD
jgi:hypothetical protein